MTEREAFEAWASDNNEWPQCVERSGDSYKLMQTKLKWEAWQAARAQPAQAVPSESAVVAGARVLNQRAAESCGVNADDQWAIYAEDFKDDVRAVLAAAQGEKP